MLQLHQGLIPVGDLVLFRIVNKPQRRDEDKKSCLTFASLSISAYVVPWYSKIGSHPADRTWVSVWTGPIVDINMFHVPKFVGPLGLTIAPLGSKVRSRVIYLDSLYPLPRFFPGIEWVRRQDCGRRQMYTRPRPFYPRRNQLSCSTLHCPRHQGMICFGHD